MPTQKTLLLVKDSDTSKVEQELIKRSIVGWEEQFEIREITSKKLSQREASSAIESNTIDIISAYAEGSYSKIIIQKGLPFNIVTLTQEIASVREVGSLLTLFEALKDDLKARNLYWLGRAMEEWGKSSLRSLNPDAWVSQFAHFGFPDVGKNLLKHLRVITDAEIRSTFSTSAAEKVGQRILHAYIQDDEPGSSSLAIKNVLEHMYPPNEVIKIDLDDASQLAHIDADAIYIYEDGLWSGVELIKRLSKICESTEFNNSAIELHFRYAATSDAGLSAARLFAKNVKNSRLRFRSAATNHFQFLTEDVDTCFTNLAQRDPASVRTAIDSAVEPYAFRSKKIWGQERENVLKICSQIGNQLIHPYLERKALEKATESGTVIDKEKLLRTATQWELGACGFGSTIVFASSIPKPVLPLMWLGGEVTINGKTLQWRPLFSDSRRIGTAVD